MSQYESYSSAGELGGVPRERVDSRAVFGQVMGLVAFTVAFAAAGAYIGRDLSTGGGWIAFIGAIGCIFGLNVAAARGKEQLSIALLFGLGLLLGIFAGPIFAFYAENDPAVLWQACGATALFVGGLGAFGYATKRDLSNWGRVLFWSLLGLILFGFVALFVAIPGANIIYAVLGLVIFGGFSIFDFWRLRRADQSQAVPIAASIFLDIFNVVLLFLSLFGGGGRR
jgi:FtsH-binding integral membrane protein